MKNEITIPEHFPDLKEEGFIAATKRRDKYSLIRDIQAAEFNGAILSRLTKEKANKESGQSEAQKQIKCKKCGKEFSVGTTTKGHIDCPECEPSI